MSAEAQRQVETNGATAAGGPGELTADVQVSRLMRDGYVMFPRFFSPAMAAQAHSELREWHARDLAERRQQGVGEINSSQYHNWKGPAGASSLSKYSHVLVDVYGKSPTLDRMFETILTDPVSAGVIEAIAGKHVKLRGYNSRLMTGQPDVLGQGWHRDSPGEFGIGILLTDVSPYTDAATAVLPGSHLLPYDPQANCLFKDDGWHVTNPVSAGLRRFAVFNRLLERKLFRGHTGASGARGDFYIFLNDTWHGRQPNLKGRETMVVLIGCYPTEFPFPEKVKLPPAEVVTKLPAAVQNILKPDPALNEKSDTVVYKTLASRQRLRPLTLFYWAALERQLLIARAQGNSLKLLSNWGQRVWSRLARRR